MKHPRRSRSADGLPRPSADMRAGAGDNILNDRSVGLDVVYFMPAPDIDRPLPLSEILHDDSSLLRDFAEISHEMEKGCDPATFHTEVTRIFTALVTTQANKFTGVQRFILHTDDRCDTDGSGLAEFAERLNQIDHHFTQTRHAPHEPSYHNLMIDRVIKDLCGAGPVPENVMRMNFIAAASTGRDIGAMIRAVPFPGARAFLQNWFYTNHGPMALVHLSHIPKNEEGRLVNRAHRFGSLSSRLQ